MESELDDDALIEEYEEAEVIEEEEIEEEFEEDDWYVHTVEL